MKYVIYLRVSTQKQGRSGLGLEAQRQMCANFIAQHHGELAKEFTSHDNGYTYGTINEQKITYKFD